MSESGLPLVLVVQRMYNSIREFVLADINQLIGTTIVGGKVNGSQVSGPIPTTSVPYSGATPANVAATATVGTATSGAPHADHAHAMGIVTTKGDILSYGSAPQRHAVGSDNSILTADSSKTDGLDYKQSIDVSGEIQGSDFKPSGLTGATAASRIVGATTSGAPASGTFSKGDAIITQDGHVFICTTAGSPGTWTDAGSSGLTNPMTTQYDIIVGGTSGTPTRQAKGSDGTFLGISGGVLGYYTPAGSGALHRIAQTIVGAGGAANIDFNSIPSTYTHLRLEIRGRSTDTVGSYTPVLLRFNADTGSNYEWEYWFSQKGANGSNDSTAQTSMQIGYVASAIAANNAADAGGLVADIPNYAGTAWRKGCHSLAGAPYRGVAGASGLVVMVNGEWFSTAAVNEITILPGAGNLAQNTIATLYGLD